MLKDRDIALLDTKKDELGRICEMEQGEAKKFVISYPLERHQAEFEKPDMVYKSIWREKELIGFLILVLDPDGRSLEFRRIVISEPGHGYGTCVVRMLDRLCSDELGRERIWLDVFEFNKRARQVYEHCGYRSFGTTEHGEKTLLLYEKLL